MRKALRIYEKAYGPAHPTVAVVLNNLAGLLNATNRLEVAEPLFVRSLLIDEKAFGRDHPNVAIRLYYLAQLLQATNRRAEAEPLMRRSLAIDENSLGPTSCRRGPTEQSRAIMGGDESALRGRADLGSRDYHPGKGVCTRSY
jgi:tetratricopeptide (TPR) repeat protein